MSQTPQSLPEPILTGQPHNARQSSAKGIHMKPVGREAVLEQPPVALHPRLAEHPAGGAPSGS